MRDNPTKQLKLQYRKLLEWGLVISLSVHVLMLQAFKRFELTSQIATADIQQLQVEDIPQTQQQKETAAPSRPTVPIASENEDLLDDEMIDLADLFDISDVEPPPPPPEDDDDMFAFVAYDEPPTPVGGYGAIQKKLVYPEIARKAGVEGRVLVRAQIDVDGTVVRTVVQTSLGPNGCDEAAVNAIKSVKWKPAYQRDSPVKVWIAVPVDFRLR